MKTKEEIEKLAIQDFKFWQDCGHYELSDLKSTDYYYDGFTNGYTQCQEDMTNKWFEYPKNIPPINSENYLVILNGSIEISLYRGDHNKFQQELSKDNNITHWMLLPNKPNKD